MDPKGKRKRTRLVRPYPADTLEVAQEVAKAVGSRGTSDGGGSIEREKLATVMGTTAKSSAFITMLNSSTKYGLTLGGYRDPFIRLTARGSSIAAPTRDQERLQALSEAAMEPEAFNRFYEEHSGKQLPDDTFSKNKLQRQFGIQAELTSECLEIIKANGVLVGFIKERGGILRVDLGRTQIPAHLPVNSSAPVSDEPLKDVTNYPKSSGGKVFVGHWGDPKAAQFVASTLDDFQIPYEYLDVQEPDGRPVPASVSEKMHNSAAAILVFANSDAPSEDDDKSQRDREQMLYQLGASSALYGDKVVVFQCTESMPKSKNISGTSNVRSVFFQEGKYREAGFELIRELHQSGIVRVGV